MVQIEKISEKYFAKVNSMSDADWDSWFNLREQRRNERILRLSLESLFYKLRILFAQEENTNKWNIFSRTLIRSSSAPPEYISEGIVKEDVGCELADVFYFCQE